jgi:hypothetical protein
METLFVLLYWPVAGALIAVVEWWLLRKGVRPLWMLLLIYLPLWCALWGISMAGFWSATRYLHLHGPLLQILGLVYDQQGGWNARYNFYYGLMSVLCIGASLGGFYPSDRRRDEERRRKKAAKAALAGGM